MKQVIMKRLLIAGIALLTVPSILLAQKEKEEKIEKDKDKEFKQIIITRTGNTDEKMVIEVDGDKIKINGKDVKDFKDVNVNVNTLNGSGMFRFNDGDRQAWSFNLDHDAHSIFSEDANRAMLGVVTEGHAKGAEIKSITKESGAEKAGLKKGDILTKIGDRKIESTDDVTEAIHAQKPGDKIGITYLRDGKEHNATAELGKWKGIKMNAVTAPRIPGMGQGQWNEDMEHEMPRAFNQFGGTYSISGNRPRLGLSIQDTDDGVGVKVLEVDEESNAAKAGIQEDDIITAIDGKEVNSTDDLTKTIRENKEKYNYKFKVLRNKKSMDIEVKMPKKLKTADL